MGPEWSEDAIKVGLGESDLEAGRDYQLRIASAQGDLTILPSLIDAALDANAAHAGFASLIKVARACKVPVFSPSPFEVVQGAILSFFPDFQEGGVVAGRMIARVINGESPATIPFYQVRTTKLAVNPGEASQLGIPLSPELVKQADTVVGQAPRNQ